MDPLDAGEIGVLAEVVNKIRDIEQYPRVDERRRTRESPRCGRCAREVSLRDRGAAFAVIGPNYRGRAAPRRAWLPPKLGHRVRCFGESSGVEIDW